MRFGILSVMTKLLEESVEKLSQLPEGRQDELARMLIDVAADDLHPYQLTNDELAAVEEGLAQAKRGEFASDEQVAAMWKRWGL
jgi:predicted transcriptional regulator